MKEPTIENVKAIICQKMKRIDPSKVTLTASFAADLKADSLDTVEVVMALEDEFDVKIPDKDAEGIRTVGDAVTYLQSRLQVKQ